MITRFKIFESNLEKKYWKIPTKDLDISLWKLKVPEHVIIEVSNHLSDKILNTPKFILFGIDYTYQDIDFINADWTFGDEWYFENKDFTKQPDIIITKKDINKYQISKEIQKYNL